MREPYGLRAGAVLATGVTPILGITLRQSLVMSRGSYVIFFARPIALTLLMAAGVLLFFSLMPLARRGLGWARSAWLEDNNSATG